MNYPLSLANVHAGYNNRHNIAEVMKGASLHLMWGALTACWGATEVAKPH